MDKDDIKKKAKKILEGPEAKKAIKKSGEVAKIKCVKGHYHSPEAIKKASKGCNDIACVSVE